jgi:hypothetical protein
VIDDDESRIVRLVVTMRSAGSSLQAIVNTLNNAGLKSKGATKFYSSTIRYMLDNPKRSYKFRTVARHASTTSFSSETM